MKYAALLIICVFAPFIGIPIALIWGGIALANHLGRDGGVVARREADAAIAAEPWWNDIHEGSL